MILRFQDKRGPQSFRRRSKSWLLAYLGIFETKIVFFSCCCISTGMRVDMSKSLASDFCDLKLIRNLRQAGGLSSRDPWRRTSKHGHGWSHHLLGRWHKPTILRCYHSGPKLLRLRGLSCRPSRGWRHSQAWWGWWHLIYLLLHCC